MHALRDLFAQALDHHRAGQPQQAEPLLRQILAAAPSHGGALHEIGKSAKSAAKSEIGDEIGDVLRNCLTAYGLVAK